MRKRLLAVAIFVIVLVVSGTLSFAYEGCGKKSKGHCGKSKNKVEEKAHMILKNKDELGLSEEQVKRIKAVKLTVKKDRIQKDAAIEIITLDIKAEKWEDVIDTEAINVLIDEKFEVKKAKAKSSVAAYAELKSILTKKQKEKLKELYKKCYKQCKIEKGKSYH